MAKLTDWPLEMSVGELGVRTARCGRALLTTAPAGRMTARVQLPYDGYRQGWGLFPTRAPYGGARETGAREARVSGSDELGCWCGFWRVFKKQETRGRSPVDVSRVNFGGALLLLQGGEGPWICHGRAPLQRWTTGHRSVSTLTARSNQLNSPAAPKKGMESFGDISCFHFR